jgi:glucose dehydrogenase
LLAFDARTGQPLWQAPAGGCGTLSFEGNRVYLVDAKERSRVLALDAATGSQVWTRAMAASCNGIIVTGGMGILSGNDHTLYAFALNEHL